MSATDIGLLTLHAAIAVIVIRTVGRQLLPLLHALNEAEESQRAYDIWLPLALAAPAAAASVTQAGGVVAAGGLGIAVAVAAALIGVGAAALAPRAKTATGGILRPFRAALIGAAATGLLLLLLAAANRLSIVVGQVIFAIWAILLWFNAPAHDRATSKDRDAHYAAGAAIALLAITTIVQAIVVACMSVEAMPTAAALCAIQAAVALAIIAARAGSVEAVRVACWVAVYGILLSIGLVSLSTLLRASWPLRDREANIAIIYGPAHGYGRFAIEAVVLFAVPLVYLMAVRLHHRARHAIGWLAIAGGAVLAGSRLAGL